MILSLQQDRQYKSVVIGKVNKNNKPIQKSFKSHVGIDNLIKDIFESINLG